MSQNVTSQDHLYNDMSSFYDITLSVCVDLVSRAATDRVTIADSEGNPGD